MEWWRERLLWPAVARDTSASCLRPLRSESEGGEGGKVISSLYILCDV